MLRSSGGPGSRLRSRPSFIAASSAANERDGFTDEATERYSNRPGAETAKGAVRFWKPQSANTGAQNPASQKRRYEFPVGAVIAVSAERCSRTPPIECRPILPGT